MSIYQGSSVADIFYLGDQKVAGLFSGDKRVWPGIFTGSYSQRVVAITTSSIDTSSFYIGGTTDLGFTANYTASEGTRATISSVTKVNKTSQIDISFNNNVKGYSASIIPTAWSVACDAQGRLYVGSEGAGIGRAGSGSIQRFTSGGVYDTTFQIPTMSANQGPRDIEILSNGDVLVASWDDDTINGNLNKLDSSGSYVSAFNCMLTRSFFDIEVVESSNVVFAGAVSPSPSTTASFYALSLITGVTSYQKQVSAPISSSIRTIKRDTLGDNLYVGGYFNRFDTTNINNIVKIDFNGTVDSSFNVGTGFNNLVTDFYVQADGKVVAVGDFTLYSGSACNRVARINTDGTFDTSFLIGSGLNGYSEHIAFFNNLYYLVGNFTTYNGVAANRIVRLDINGLKA